MNYKQIKTLSLAILASTGFFLNGCAAKYLPGYQPVFHKYEVADNELRDIEKHFKKAGLKQASVSRDSFGRVQLTGTYNTEDDVDLAFAIVQDTVGIKRTSRFYPRDIKRKRWTIAAERALKQILSSNDKKFISQISSFKKSKKLTDENIKQILKVKEEFYQSISSKNTKTANSKVGHKHALIIGINDFPYITNRDATILGATDAKTVAKIAEKENYNVIKLLNEQATHNNMRTEIKKLGDLLNQPEHLNDVLFIYISSHGYPTPAPFSNASKMRIVAYDAKGENTEQMMKYTIGDTDIIDILMDRPGNSYFVIDTCFSGNILSPKKNKGILISVSEKHLCSNAANADQCGKNRTIITATSEGERSWGGSKKDPTFIYRDGTKLEGSYFTQAFFHELGKTEPQGLIEPAFKKARDFTTDIVANEVTKEHKDAKQHPSMKPDSLTDNLFVEK